MPTLWQLGLRARAGFAKVVPEPLTLTIVLFGATAIAATLGPTGPRGVVEVLVGPRGLWNLLAFAMQIGLMLILGHAVAAARPVQAAIVALVGLPRGPRALVALVAAGAIGLSLINWSLGLVGGALLAREAGATARRRGLALHYPILCAAGYAGLMTWHGGLSGTAPLKVTGMKDLIEVLGPELAARTGEIPLSRSLLGPLNLQVTLGLLVLGPLFFAWITPPAGRDPAPQPAPPPEAPAPATVATEGSRWIDGLERSPLVTLLLLIPLVTIAVHQLAARGLARLDLDTFNVLLWVAALALHLRPSSFLAACEEGVRGCTGVFLQFPMYAGIMAVIVGSGAAAAMSESLTGVEGKGFLVLVFASAGLLNLFVPSGGGQWAVQGPIVIDAALRLGVAPEHAMLAVAYGDQWTNMIQPFWALPLLAITGTRARDLVGYSALWMVLGGAWIGASLWLHG